MKNFFLIFLVFFFKIKTVDAKTASSEVWDLNLDGNRPCGQEGSVDERILDCSFQEGSQKGQFFLVTRSINGIEVYRDVASGLIWSDRMAKNYRFHSPALSICSNLNSRPNHSGVIPFLGIPDLTWRLPSADDFLQAEKNNIRQELPDMNHYFWTSTIYPTNPYYAYVFSSSGELTTYQRELRDNIYQLSVRCVAELKKD
jgi:hypothetical protein